MREKDGDVVYASRRCFAAPLRLSTSRAIKPVDNERHRFPEEIRVRSLLDELGKVQSVDGHGPSPVLLDLANPSQLRCGPGPSSTAVNGRIGARFPGAANGSGT